VGKRRGGKESDKIADCPKIERSHHENRLGSSNNDPAAGTYADSENLNMLGGLGDKRPLSEEEVAKQKAADVAYKAAIGKIPAQKSSDPWGQVRDGDPSKNSQIKPLTAPK
jgi:hypothetical protein